MESLKSNLKKSNQVILDLKVIANSSCLKLEKLTDNSYKLKITKVAQKGQANAEIIKFFKDNLKPLKVEIEILSGSLKANKKISIKLLK